MTAGTIFAAFSEAAAHAGRPALITPRTSLTYDALQARILRLAGDLVRSTERSPVAVLSSTAEDVLTAFLACAAAGRPAFLLDPTLPLPRLQSLVSRYGVPLLLAEEKFAAPFTEIELLIFGRAPAGSSFALPTVQGDAEFYWGLTSGSTGEPKLFARSHRSWLESFRAAEQRFAFPPESRILIPGPFSHSLFLYGAVHALCRGHTVLATGAFRPDRAVTAARHATHAYLVPSMLAEMLDCGLAARGALRTIFCGGAKLPAALRARCEAALPAVDLVEFYGASETSFVAAASTTRPAPAGSVGTPFPGVDIEIRDAAGRQLPAGYEGEVHIRSPMLFSRYVGERAHEGWFTAGDLGFLDHAGNLYLTGRRNRVINSRALKIRPEPIEEALLELPGVLRAGVVDLPDARRGAIAVAAVEFVPGASLARRALSQHCRAKIGARFCPQRYYSAEALPLTRSGKIAFPLLRDALLSQDPRFRELT
jgi:long-chain acyl-CoA synthetase